MKKFVTYLSILVSVLILQTCGGKGVVSIVGPDLDLNELISLEVDQLMVNGGTEDDGVGTPEFAVYLRSSLTGKDVACAGKDQGLDVAKTAGVYYGKLKAEFVPVEDISEEEGINYELVFVEKDSENCPKPISSEDDIVGTSSAVGVSESGTGSLVDNQIQATNGLAAARLIIGGGEAGTVPSMEASQDKFLIVDQIYFSEPDVGEATAYFSLYLSEVGNTGVPLECSIGTSELVSITKDDIIYGWLDKKFECTNYAEDTSILSRKVIIIMMMQTGDSTTEIGRTDAATIGELVGEKVMLKEDGDDVGHIIFRK